MSRIIALERRGTWASRLGSLPTGTSISLHGTITVSSMLATARENRSMANTTLCWENSLFVWSNDIVFLNVEFVSGESRYEYRDMLPLVLMQEETNEEIKTRESNVSDGEEGGF